MPSSAPIDRAVERLLRHDRRVVLALLALITALGWAYLYSLVLTMESMPAHDAGTVANLVRFAPWGPADAAWMFVMWAVMMVAMMLPSATPMVLLYARALRHRARDSRPLIPSGTFLGGYLALWTAFSAAATLLQWLLESAALMSPMMVANSSVLGGLLLLAAALYQWTPIKNVCLERCRSPVWLLSRIWRDGLRGAFRMGLEHGAWCLGCCWALMLLLFVGGIMNLVTIAAITVFVLVEKVLPGGRVIGRAGSLLLAAAGLWLLARA